MRKALALVVALFLTVGACSDDDDAAPSRPSRPSGTITTSPTIRALAPGEIDTTRSPYCATWAELRSQGGPKTSGMDEAAASERRKQYYGSLLPLVDRLLEQADAEIRPAVEVARRATGEAASTGAFEPFETDEAKASTRDLAQYAVDNCTK